MNRFSFRSPDDWRLGNSSLRPWLTSIAAGSNVQYLARRFDKGLGFDKLEDSRNARVDVPLLNLVFFALQ